MNDAAHPGSGVGRGHSGPTLASGQSVEYSHDSSEFILFRLDVDRGEPNVPIKVQCSQCETNYTLPDTASGRKVRCKKCQAVIAVPELEPDIPEADEAEVEDTLPPPPAKKAAPPAPVRSKLARMVLTLIVVGILMSVAGAALFFTSKRTVTRTVQSETPNGKSVGTSYSRERNPVQLYAAIGAAGLAVLAYVTVSVLVLVWFVKAWDAVPERHGGMSGFKAVGLLLVPLFNVYWMFRVIPGLSAALVDTLKSRYPGKKFDAGRGAGLGACVMSFIPVLNVLTPLALLVWFNTADYAVGQVRAGREARDAG